MSYKELPIIEELPLIGVALIVVNVAAAGLGAVLWSVRQVLRLSGEPRPVAHTPAW